ncbi:hypothetical protein E4T44_00162 [Aureobasidium sp. EXF-8845]|nr:hypothetical protein E4T44_00162 [Aureobasidium sp. EXF-8845]KAI4858290.1 hypothetical protein E4T45_00195 [Aureobasidium sp. EXF-8846]
MPSNSLTAPSDGYFDLGAYSRCVTAANQEAELWFNRGLIWMYGFNRVEAVTCFNRAISADPACAMAYWGVAHSSGAYYNKAWKLFDPEDLRQSLQRSSDAAQKAFDLRQSCSSLERALIESLQQRYAAASADEDLSKRDVRYANAMEQVYERFGEDLDVAALSAEALMNLTPWTLWDPSTGQPTPQSRAHKVGRYFDKALEKEAAWRHPGVLHLYIHYIEMSQEPERGLKAADCLRNLVPDSGHLNHMPSHLDILVGNYDAAITANRSAVVADSKYLNKIGGRDLYTFYRVHDYHSLIYAAMLSGRSRVALQNVAELEESLDEELLRIESPPMADWLEAFLAVRPHILVRFGMWEEILRLKLPKDRRLYCVTTTTIHYAQGVAHAALGNIDEALKSQTQFKEAYELVPSTRYDYPNKCVDALKIGEAMLAGEIEYRRQNYDEAFRQLEETIRLDDKLIYSEPWGWMQPTRHAYGALLLEQGRVEDAAAAYAADLGLDSCVPRGRQHPNNIWALQGYHECLTRLGRHAEANIIALPLKLTRALADVSVSSSCYCRRSPAVDDKAETCC